MHLTVQQRRCAVVHTLHMTSNRGSAVAVAVAVAVDAYKSEDVRSTMWSAIVGGMMGSGANP